MVYEHLFLEYWLIPSLECNQNLATKLSDSFYIPLIGGFKQLINK